MPGARHSAKGCIWTNNHTLCAGEKEREHCQQKAKVFVHETLISRNRQEKRREEEKERGRKGERTEGRTEGRRVSC